MKIFYREGFVVAAYCNRSYSAQRSSKGTILTATINRNQHSVVLTEEESEESARRWLCDHSLRKSKAKKLLAAALRGEGEFADPENKARVR